MIDRLVQYTCNWKFILWLCFTVIFHIRCFVVVVVVVVVVKNWKPPQKIWHITVQVCVTKIEYIFTDNYNKPVYFANWSWLLCPKSKPQKLSKFLIWGLLAIDEHEAFRTFLKVMSIKNGCARALKYKKFAHLQITIIRYIITKRFFK